MPRKTTKITAAKGPKSHLFIDLAVDGQFADMGVAFNDYVAKWHAAGTDMPVHEWLGLSKDEYAAIVEKPSAILDVVTNRVWCVPWGY